MVEYTLQLDSVFNCLSDATRRDILKRVAKEEMTVTEVAKPYKLTFAAISKHLKILEKAKLILKHKRGKERVITLSPAAFKDAAAYLNSYQKFWEESLDKLEIYLNNNKV